ncbi:MAG: hypothetical protein ACK5YR_21580 [Pirellula sp.]|jgi:hypothetical protein
MAKVLMTTTVARCKATTLHSTGHFDSQGTPVVDKMIENPCALSIVSEDGSIYLWRLNEEGECVADTWHMTVDEAKRQAEFEFEIDRSGWRSKGE